MKLFQSVVVVAAILISACTSNPYRNVAHDKPADTTRQTVSATPKLSPALEKLLTHFKDNSNFPVEIDSAYIAKVNKGDSLGTNEMKLLVAKWAGDSMDEMLDYDIRDFYTIDSVKAKGTYAEWLNKPGTPRTVQSNAYMLQKIKLADNTLVLLWALNASQERADPIFNSTNVYFTTVFNGNIMETSVIGQLMVGVDPPGEGDITITGKLSNDGKLVLKKVELSKDFDDMKGEISKTQFDFAIDSGKIVFKGRKEMPVKHIKVKS